MTEEVLAEEVAQSVDGHEILMDPVEIAQRLDRDELIAFDTETTGLSPWKDHLALLQFYGNETGTLGLVRTPGGVIPDPIRQVLESGKTFVGHNVTAFDIPFIHTHGVDWRKSKWYDTLIGESVITTSGRRDVSKSLRASVRRRLNLDIDKNIEHGHWDAEELSPEQIQYGASDVLSLIALRNSQVRKAEQSTEMQAVNMEMELLPAVAMMSINGLPLRPDILEAYRQEQIELGQTLEKQLHQLFGPINLNSTQQLKRALAEEGVEVKNTQAGTLQDLAAFGGKAGDIAQMILDWKGPAQRLKMYGEDWADRFIVDDRVHARFWQVGADTGRFTSSDPNLQQVPKDGRKIFGNIPGMTMVSCDYSQIEVRIAAYLAQDAVLIEQLKQGDVHRAVASQVFDIPPDQVTDRERKLSKALTFTLLFGGGAGTLYDYARHSGSSITFDESSKLVVQFFTTFSGLGQMRKKAYKMAQERNIVILTMPNGMRRVLVGRKKAATVILNTSVQGSAAVGLKYGLIEADKAGLTKYIGGTVHDEIVATVPDNEAVEYGIELEKAMVAGMSRVLPILVKAEVKQGYWWQP